MFINFFLFKNYFMIKKNIATNEFGFIFNPSTGDSFSSNSTAAEIIQLLKTQHSISEIKKIIVEKYDIEKSVIEKDIEEFMIILKENNLLVS